MDIPLPSSPQPAPPSVVGQPLAALMPVDRQAAWQALLSEMSELHAKLEYLRVMLKIGVRSF